MSDSVIKKFAANSINSHLGPSEQLASNPPWLIDVSDDNHIWIIRDVLGSKQDVQKINFNIKLRNGSVLYDPKNRPYYHMAKEYANAIRLFMPDITAMVHLGRVRSLLTFFYWLKLYNIHSLSEVTSDHIQLYSEQLAFGKEWAIQSPHHLVRYLNNTYLQNIELPVVPRYISKLATGKIYNSANVAFLSKNALPLCTAILRWTENQGHNSNSLPPLKKILENCEKTPRPVTSHALHRDLLAIDELWVFKHHLPKPNLKFNPFPHGSHKVAKKLGVMPNKHPTIPPKLAFRYLTDALKWVLEYSPIILNELNHGIDYQHLTAQLRKAGLEADIVKHSYAVASSTRKLNIEGLIRLLASACLCVIGALSARRLNEITDLGAGCVDKDQDGNYWLVIYIEKTSRRYDQIPIPTAVYKAIHCMEQISKTAREETSASDSIWQWKVHRQEIIKKIDPATDLNNLAVFSGTFKDSEITWKFSCHQFRRFFAVLYFWRYEKGDLGALSHHLRHFDLEMTKRYVTDVEFGKMWKEVEQEWQGKFLQDVIEGSRSVGGKAGNRLKKESKKLIDYYRKKVDVVAPQRALQKLQRLAKKWGSEFRQHVWGTICACPQRTGFAEHARCKGSSRTGPVFQNAGEDTCASCPFAIHTERFNEFVLKDIVQKRNNATCCGSDTILGELSNVQVVSLEKALQQAKPLPLMLEEDNEQ